MTRCWMPLMGAAFVVAGCGGTPTVGEGDGDDDPIFEAGPICINRDCGDIFVIGDVPDAENLLRTSSGRLFVSGGTQVFEVLADAGAFTLAERAGESCNFTGMTEAFGHLYAACGDGGLFAASLESSSPTLARIHTLDGVGLPNGMATGPDDCLYITDGPLAVAVTTLLQPKIVRVCPDPTTPTQILEQSTWLNLTLNYPNGLIATADALIYTDTAIGALQSRIVEVPFMADGAPGESRVIYSQLTLFDDLTRHGNTLVVTDFLAGRLLQIDRDGLLLQQSAANSHVGPSSVLVAGPPVFRPLDVLVTEKGLLGDTISGIGNRLVIIRQRD